MKMSFSKTESVPTPVEGVTVESTTTAGPATPVADKAESIPTRPASEQTTAVARRDAAPSEHAIFDDNNIGFEDIVIPRINIVQKVGDLSNVFTPGELVLDQSLVIHTPASQKDAGDPPINLTVIGFKKTVFVEKVEGGALGDIARSEEDVVRKGGTLDYKEWKQSEKDAKESNGKALRYFQRMATALILVEKPANVADDDQTIFPYECEGRYYTLALWSMKGTAYTNAAKNIFTHRKIGHLRTVVDKDGNKRGGYPTNSYTLTTKLENYFGNYAHIPVLKPGPKNTEAFRSFVNSILGLE